MAATNDLTPLHLYLQGLQEAKRSGRLLDYQILQFDQEKGEALVAIKLLPALKSFNFGDTNDRAHFDASGERTS